MTKKILFGLGALLVIFIVFIAYQMITTRSHSPVETVEASNGDLVVEVTYCKPYKKERLIFGPESEGALVPWGKYWRLGANDATEITFSAAVNFAGEAVPAGSYRMYAVPSENTWEVSLNSELGEFGYFEPDYSKDVLKVDVPVGAASQETEQFTIELNEMANGVQMSFIWDKTKVEVPITLQ